MKRYSMFSSNENVDYSASTKKAFGGRKLFLLIMAIFAAVSDFAAIIVFAIAGYGGIITVPVLLLVLDALFIAGICLSNFRFIYAIGIWTAYIVVAVILLSFISLTQSSTTVVMTDVATTLNVLSHIALFCALAVAGIYPLLKNNVKTKAIVITTVAVAAILIGSFTVFFSVNGYFGQGFTGEYRLVGYTLDDATDTYIATSIRQGRSKKVIIPEEFNGKKVSAVDCYIFTDTTVNNIQLQSSAELKFLDTVNLANFNDSMTVGVDRKFIDTYRREFIKNVRVFSFANSLYPMGLAQDERYITFAYEDYDATADIIPTWIGKNSDIFDLSYASELEFLQHLDEGNPSDLIWCWENNNAKILREFKDEKGNIIVGKAVNESIDKVDVQFKNVFKLFVADDNDSKYEPSVDLKVTVDGDKTYEGRFVTADTIDGIIGEFTRDGFDLTWTFRGIINNKAELTSLKSVLESELGKSATIAPQWELKAPTNVVISLNQTNYIYGDTVALSASATAPNSDCVLEYEWLKVLFSSDGYSVMGAGDEFVMSNVLPSQSGDYCLHVTAKSDETTSLTSSTVILQNIQIGKRPLNISWQLPSDMVYDSQIKELSYSIGQGELINGDLLTDSTAEITNTNNSNAGSYTAKITLKGGMEALYSIVSGGSFKYSITPRPVQAQWSGGDFEYNGALQNVEVNAKDLLGFDLPITISGAKINAGSYTASAYSNNSNYVLENPTFGFEIRQKSVTVLWENKNFVYSGVAQYPKVLSVNGIVGNDNITNEFEYSEYLNNIDAGEGYWVKVALPASSNYKFDSEQSTSYNIDRRNLRLRAVARDKVYDGKVNGLNFEVVEGLASVHTKNDLGAPIFNGNGVSAIDAGTYDVTFSMPVNSVTKNYNITCDGATFTISKVQAALVWSQFVVEDGVVTAPEVLISGQVYEGNITVTRYILRDSSGSEISEITEADGTYSIEAVVTSVNYTFSNTRVNFGFATLDGQKGEVA